MCRTWRFKERYRNDVIRVCTWIIVTVQPARLSVYVGVGSALHPLVPLVRMFLTLQQKPKFKKKWKRYVTIFYGPRPRPWRVNAIHNNMSCSKSIKGCLDFFFIWCKVPCRLETIIQNVIIVLKLIDRYKMLCVVAPSFDIQLFFFKLFLCSKSACFFVWPT